jgi:hypothetical protein
MIAQSIARLTLASFLLMIYNAQADTTTTSTPSRGDSIAKGDRIILNTDAPIFTLDANAGDKSQLPKACVPWRSQIEIESAPTTTTTTTATANNAAGPGAAPKTKTTVTGAVTTSESTGAPGDAVTTKSTTSTTATARIVRVGPSALRRKIDHWLGIEGAAYEIPSDTDATKMVSACRQVPTGMQKTVKAGTTYSFTPSDLDGYSSERFGLTYGVIVVPNKVIIADRSFIASSSVLPYVGYEAWGPGIAGALVFAAGVGTAPASTQTATTSGTSAGTKATFSVATGMVGSIAGVFKVGLLVGVDTQGRNTGFKYQGKPWLGISLGAGTQ